ncbi:hypothetical protein BJX70DRAFT_52644 [Aspergillus crustosus]
MHELNQGGLWTYLALNIAAYLTGTYAAAFRTNVATAAVGRRALRESTGVFGEGPQIVNYLQDVLRFLDSFFVDILVGSLKLDFLTNAASHMANRARTFAGNAGKVPVIPGPGIALPARDFGIVEINRSLFRSSHTTNVRGLSSGQQLVMEQLV